MLHQLGKGSFPEVIDSTIVAEWKACPAKTYFSHFLHLGAKYESIDLIAGGAFALGMEIIRKEYYGNKKSLQDALRIAFPAVITAYGNPDVPANKEAKSLDRVVEALVAYLQKWPPETDHIQPHMVDGQPSVEFTFSLPLPFNHPQTGNPLVYGGRFDLLGVYRDNLVVVDEKTTSQLGPTWSAKWNLRGQFTGYCWAAREYGRPVVGAIVRGVSFLKNSFGFEESLQMRSQEQMDLWHEDMLATVEDMLDAWATGRYAQNFADSCSAYGNCAFQRLCSVRNFEPWIEGNYGVRKWNPLEKVPIKVEAAPVMETVSLADAMRDL
jgi:hypothetical protein